MVLYFGISSLDGPQPQCVFSQCFAPSLTLTDEIETCLSHTSSEQIGVFHRNIDEFSSRIAEKIHSIAHFQRASHLRDQENGLQAFNIDEYLPSLDVGHFTLTFTANTGIGIEACSSENQVVWLIINDIGFCFVLNEGESTSEAEIALRLIVQQLHGVSRIALQNQLNDFGTKSERINFVLRKYVSGGNFVLTNHRLVRKTEKDAEVVFKTMSM